MGGGQKRGRTQRRHFKQSRDNVWKHNNKNTTPQEDPSTENPNPNSNPSWEPFATQNLAFEEYYKEQCIVPEEEWDEFMSLLRKPLPASFRINSSGQFFQDIRSQLENDFMKSLEADVNNEYEMEAIRPLPWYPGNLAWHLNYSRMQLRKNQTLERFHEFLKLENEIGNITRQESVSMVPPLFLDVLPDHYILDMCAAPGSKTFQLLEIMHQSAELGLLPNGLVIANDVDVQRCNLLIHQTKRMCNANLIVTNHEAQHFPKCHVICNSLDTFKIKDVNGELTSSLPSHGLEEMANRRLLFDRVLCDVPCSGDGTLRKAPDIWRKWNAGMGNGVHRLQVQIALRGIALLKVGGRMVYSTCSMNPVENEAVVAEVLRKCGGSVELLDVSTELPELIRCPGLKKWKVRDKGLWLASYKDVPTNRKGAIVPSMFPSGQSCEVNKILCSDMKMDMETPENDGMGENLAKLSKNQDDNADCDHNYEDLENAATLSCTTEALTETERNSNPCEPAEGLKSNQEEEVSNLPLHYCIRILPHDQNSGAFFIAVLRKISPLNGLMDNQSPRNKKRRAVLANTSEVHDGPFEDVQGQHQHVLAEAASESVEVGAKVDKNGVSSQDTESEGTGACILESNMEGIRGTKGDFQIQGKWRGVDPVVFLQDVTIINSIKTFYGINQSFPLDGHLVTRNSDANHVKRIYYISKSVHDVLKLNFKVGQQLKITSLGLKMFERQTSRDGSSPCAFRISSEGLPLMLPYISKQILSAPLTDFQHLLRYRVIKFSDFVDSILGEKASNLMAGCCVVVLNKGDQPTDTITVDASTIAIGCWKGKSNLSVMVSQMDSQELLERLSVRFGVGEVTPSSEDIKIVNREADTILGSIDVELKEDSEEPEQETVEQE